VKLIIQIPCYNEEEALPEALSHCRASCRDRQVEWLIINDGSKDRTVEVARAHGVDHIVDLPVNMGLAHGFMAGLHRAIAEGADIIVNTDADNQYNAADIPKLIQPILDRRRNS
jgi:glycosyltransferase involved in cell wall biosynthesis